MTFLTNRILKTNNGPTQYAGTVPGTPRLTVFLVDENPIYLCKKWMVFLRGAPVGTVVSVLINSSYHNSDTHMEVHYNGKLTERNLDEYYYEGSTCPIDEESTCSSSPVRFTLELPLGTQVRMHDQIALQTDALMHQIFQENETGTRHPYAENPRRRLKRLLSFIESTANMDPILLVNKIYNDIVSLESIQKRLKK